MLGACLTEPFFQSQNVSSFLIYIFDRRLQISPCQNKTGYIFTTEKQQDQILVVHILVTTTVEEKALLDDRALNMYI